VFDTSTRVAHDLDHARRVAWREVTGPHEVAGITGGFSDELEQAI
jgi:para-nitrobenzyl esterase